MKEEGPTPSPVTLEELDLLKRTVFLTEEDTRYLQMVGDVAAERLEEILDAWFSAHPHLYDFFRGPDGKLNMAYVEAVRRRSGEWILATCRHPYDEAWLAYTHEVALRHHRTKKNQTDGVVAPPHIPLRFVIAFSYHTMQMIKPFLAASGQDHDVVQKMHEAWSKSVLLQVALWSYVYTPRGDW